MGSQKIEVSVDTRLLAEDSVTVRHAKILDRVFTVLLWISILTYNVVFLRLLFRRFDHLGMMSYDLGIFDQAVWLISRGYSPFLTVRGLHLFADHFSVFLYLLAPLYWIWDSPKAILTAQTIALSLGALPVFKLSNRTLKSPFLALSFALVYLLYPTMEWTNIYEFHPETFATPLLLSAFYFLFDRNWKGYFVSLVLAMLTKETVSLAVVTLGLYVLFMNRRVGLITIGMGMTTFFIALITLRWFNHGQPSPYFWLYMKYGATPGQIAWHLVMHPAEIVIGLITDINRDYALKLLYPLAFLPLLAPEVSLMIVPVLLSNLLSRSQAMHLINGQYTAVITPFLLFAAIVGLERWKRWGSTRTLILMTVCMICFAMDATMWGPLRVPSAVLPLEVSDKCMASVQAVLDAIPGDASVSADVSLGPYLCHRRRIFTYPNPFYRAAWGSSIQTLEQEIEHKNYPSYTADSFHRSLKQLGVEYIVLCPSIGTFLISRDAYADFAEILLKNPYYGIVKVNHTTLLLRRGADHKHGIALLQDVVGVTARSRREVEALLSSMGCDFSLRTIKGAL